MIEAGRAQPLPGGAVFDRSRPDQVADGWDEHAVEAIDTGR